MSLAGLLQRPGPTLRGWRQVWRSLSGVERGLLLPSWCLLGLARLLILVLEFPQLTRLLGTEIKTGDFCVLLAPQQLNRATAIGRAVELIARHTPWASLCQAQALVARFWLACFGIPYRLYYGARRNELGQLEAHAWLVAGPVFVTGGNGSERFAVLAGFASRRQAQVLFERHAQH